MKEAKLKILHNGIQKEEVRRRFLMLLEFDLFCLQINTYNFYFSCISVQVHVNIIIKQKNKLVLLVVAALALFFSWVLG